MCEYESVIVVYFLHDFCDIPTFGFTYKNKEGVVDEVAHDDNQNKVTKKYADAQSNRKYDQAKE